MIKKMFLVIAAAAVVVLADAGIAPAQDAGESGENLVWNATGTGALGARQRAHRTMAVIGLVLGVLDVIIFVVIIVVLIATGHMKRF